MPTPTAEVLDTAMRSGWEDGCLARAVHLAGGRNTGGALSLAMARASPKRAVATIWDVLHMDGEVRSVPALVLSRLKAGHTPSDLGHDEAARLLRQWQDAPRAP